MARGEHKLTVNPPLGRLPVLQYLAPGELLIDADYQRGVESGSSQALIRRIAQRWNWDLCLPLVIARRGVGLFVIDGQHRLVAAKMRGDIAQLPCVVVDYASAADEAASFVQLNQQRVALREPQVFRAAIASGDSEACAIVAAIESAGLRIAPHDNYTSWKFGMVANIGGIQSSWRKHGPKPTGKALAALALAWPREVLRYAGTIFPGMAAVAYSYPRASASEIATMVRLRTQADWRTAIMQRRAIEPNLRFANASAAVLLEAWRDFCGEEEAAQGKPIAPADPLPGFVPDHENRSWCNQCDMRVTRAQGMACKSRHCSLRQAV